MFGFLKKKLKEAAEKISTAISKPEETPTEEKQVEQSVEEKTEIPEEIEEPKETPIIPEIKEDDFDSPSPFVEEVEETKEEPDDFDAPSPFTDEQSEPIEDTPEKPDDFDSPSPFVEESKPEVEEEIVEPEVIPEVEQVVSEPEKVIVPELETQEVEEVIEPEVEEVIEPEVKQVVSEPEVEEVVSEPEVKPDVPEVKAEEPIEPPKKKSFFDKLTSMVTEKKVSETEVSPILEEMKFALLQSDVALEVAETICDDLKNALVGQSVKRGQVEKIIQTSLKNSITGILDQPKVDLLQLSNEKKPLSIVFLGFNGTGKTTTIARLGKMFKDNNKKVLFAAADTFRAAAIHQLEEHGKNLKIEVIKHDYGADPAAVIFDAVKAATARDVDIVLADTAGRSQANLNLMEELKKIIRVNKPDLKILVVDCLTGNDAVDQARLFDEAVGVDGIIMTKADVYEKGGAVLSASHAINKPILYIGTGQDYQDIEKFDVDKVVQTLLE
jgi:fused signal recognition particle receptor